MATQRKVCLINGSRTPIGTMGKSLSRVTVDKLAEHVLVHAIRKAAVDPNQVDGIILGHGYQSAYTPNTARYAALNAGLPASIPAMTVQRQCGSGMEALNLAAKEILLGNGDVYLAGGVESMSTVPYLIPGKMRWEQAIQKKNKFGPRVVIGAPLADDGLVPLSVMSDTRSANMGATAQRLADTYNVSRKEQDEYAYRSHMLASAALKDGRFNVEVDPIEVPGRGFFKADEHPRGNTTLEKLGELSPVARPSRLRTITAGNSSGVNDGACAVILASEERAKELGLEPLAYMIDSVVTGLDPEQMGLGPVAAIEKLLKRNDLTLKDIDLFEINEAFAAQYLACEKLLGIDREKVNVNGGAIALGHPIGMSGARLPLTLAHELRRRGLKRGIASLCIGGGMGIATLIEAA
jgi:acetyl-CoA C-acetyltransferase